MITISKVSAIVCFIVLLVFFACPLFRNGLATKSNYGKLIKSLIIQADHTNCHTFFLCSISQQIYLRICLASPINHVEVQEFSSLLPTALGT